MRKIKFRAWIPSNQTMIRHREVIERANLLFEGSLNFSDIVMQSTGLKDKNKVEIYEGDIVKGEWDVVEEIYVSDVQFYGGAFRVHKTGLPLEYGYMRRECEVIGNIYENPELLDNN